MPRIWVRKGWLFWQAINPDEVVGLLDSNTKYRSRTREGAIEKCRRAFAPRQESEWEEVHWSSALSEEEK